MDARWYKNLKSVTSQAEKSFRLLLKISSRVLGYEGVMCHHLAN